MEKIIPDGTEVLIFKYAPSWEQKQEEARFIKGVIESSEILEKPTMHGSPWMIRFYKVIGEDNDIYYGTYDTNIKGSHYFRTIPDHINKIKQKIKNNYEQINKLNNDNFELCELMMKLNEDLYKKEKITDKTEKEPYIRFKSLEEQTIALARKNADAYKKRR